MTKKVFEVPFRQILAAEIVYEASIDRRWDAFRGVRESCCSWDTQQAMVVNNSIKAFKFITALPQSVSSNESHAGRSQSKFK